MNVHELGQRIRIIRDMKGYTLNGFAKKIGVSSGYLSNLETGKTEKVSLEILKKIQKELLIFPTVPPDQEDEDSFRVNRALEHYKQLAKKDPKTAEYLLSNFENGLEFFSKK
jgi:transcriptional regulator with XRE-family HTH domain